MTATHKGSGVTLTTVEVGARRLSPARRARRLWSRIRTAGVAPVSAASVAVFRIAFGVSIIINAALYLPRIIREHHIEPTFHFSYGPADFVEPLPGVGMYVIYAAMMITGGLIALGRWHRWAAATFFLLTTYVFLLDPTFYQNHEYLISLLAALMVLLPVDGFWSLDARVGARARSDVVPAWVVWMLRLQIGIPYFFAGIAKLNADWLRGEPLRTWLAARTDLEPFHSVLTNSSVVWIMVYGALILDLLAVPLLLSRTTRVAAFVALCAFHVTNALLFGLYIFPWLMIAATLIFFQPDWPLRIRHRFRQPDPRHLASREPLDDQATEPSIARRHASPALTTLLGIWVLFQILFPLRHLAFEGNSSWTEEGHRFAWHMMLRDKSGTVHFELTDGDRTWTVDPAAHLTADQTRELPWYPEHLVQFAHHLSELYDGAEVRAETSVSLNGRDHQPIVDPTVDLASVSTVWWGHAPWIVPLGSDTSH